MSLKVEEKKTGRALQAKGRICSGRMHPAGRRLGGRFGGVGRSVWALDGETPSVDRADCGGGGDERGVDSSGCVDFGVAEDSPVCGFKFSGFLFRKSRFHRPMSPPLVVTKPTTSSE